MLFVSGEVFYWGPVDDFYQEMKTAEESDEVEYRHEAEGDGA